MARKTININALVSKANQMLKSSADNALAERQGIISFISDMLMETGNYHGFKFLVAEQMASNSIRPGINYLNGMPHPDVIKRFENTDATRIEFFVRN